MDNEVGACTHSWCLPAARWAVSGLQTKALPCTVLSRFLQLLSLLALLGPGTGWWGAQRCHYPRDASSCLVDLPTLLSVIHSEALHSSQLQSRPSCSSSQASTQECVCLFDCAHLPPEALCKARDNGLAFKAWPLSPYNSQRKGGLNFSDLL